MSLIQNIAIVATDFAQHPFSDTGKVGPRDLSRNIILDKAFASPTISQEPLIRREQGDQGTHDAGQRRLAEVANYADQGPSKPPEPPKPGMPAHKIALLFFIVLTVGCLVANAALAFGTTEPYSSVQDKVFEALDWGFKTGVGAIIGVLTGKASNLNP